MSVRFLLFALVFEIVFSAEKNTKCVTPDYEIGTCVPINTCPELDDGVKTKNRSLEDFAKNSQCGFDSIPLVCCKASTYANITSIYDKFFITLKPTMIPYIDSVHLPDRTTCGLGKEHKDLPSGNHITIGQFPWMAALVYKFNENDTSAGIRCDGTLIHSRYVLTAAHCMDGEEFGLTHVLLGEWDYMTDPDCSPKECADYVRHVGVEKQIPHPFYSFETHNNDIGLLRLIHNVAFSSYVRPICLPPLDHPIPSANNLLELVGWGRKENGIFLDKPRKFKLFITSDEICKEILEDRNVSYNHLCVQTMEEVNNYTGNSGGPLMQIYTDTDKLQMYQEGVILNGFSSGLAKFSASYTRVSKFIIWIIRNLSGKYS